jgi:hypothetical protein
MSPFEIQKSIIFIEIYDTGATVISANYQIKLNFIEFKRLKSKQCDFLNQYAMRQSRNKQKASDGIEIGRL